MTDSILAEKKRLSAKKEEEKPNPVDDEFEGKDEPEEGEEECHEKDDEQARPAPRKKKNSRQPFSVL